MARHSGALQFDCSRVRQVTCYGKLTAFQELAESSAACRSRFLIHVRDEPTAVNADSSESSAFRLSRSTQGFQCIASHISQAAYKIVGSHVGPWRKGRSCLSATPLRRSC